MGIPEPLTCLLRNLYSGQETTVRTGHGATDWFRIGKGVCQGCILSPCLFNSYEEYMMWNAGLDESQAGTKMARRNINDLRYADDTTLMAESEEEGPKGPLDECERREWKNWLETQHSEIWDHGIWSHHFMANRRGKVEAMTDFTFLGFKIPRMVTEATKLKDVCSLEEKIWQIWRWAKSLQSCPAPHPYEP